MKFTKIISHIVLIVGLIVSLSAVALDGGLDISYKFGTAETPKGNIELNASSRFVSNYTGSAAFNIPLPLPPGRRGMSPELNLSYNSQAAKGNPSLVGQGFSITQSYIQRNINYTRKTTSDDYFEMMLGGSMYKLVSTASSDGVGRYRTKQNTDLRIELKSNHWLVTEKDGTQHRFGYATNSRKQIESSDSSINYVWRWSLDQTKDTFGNPITYSYETNYRAFHSSDKGTVYPKEIRYNSGVKVSFKLQTRPDRLFYMNQGSEYRMAARLDEIQVHFGAQLVGRFRFDYTADAYNQRSQLKTVTRIGSDNASSIRLGEFSYNTLRRYFRFGKTWNTNGQKLDIRKIDGDADVQNDVLDVDGDGRPDYVSSCNSDRSWCIRFNTKNGFSSSVTTWGLPGSWNIRDVQQYKRNEQSADTRAAPMDFDGDGFIDHVWADGDPYLDFVLNKGTASNHRQGFTGRQRLNAPRDIRIRDIGSKNTEDDAPNVQHVVRDFNGDGMPDVIHRSASNRWTVYLKHKTGFHGGINIPVHHSGGYIEDVQRDDSDVEVTLQDVNSDGLPDIVREGNPWRVWYNTGTQFIEYGCSNCSKNNLDDHIIDIEDDTDNPNDIYSAFMDINGDGYPDHLRGRSDSRISVSFGTGYGFRNKLTWSGHPYGDGFIQEVTDDDDESIVRRQLLDLNGDGLPDVVKRNDTSWIWRENAAGPQGLIKKATFEYGGSVEFSYINTAKYTHTHLPNAQWVVSKSIYRNGMGGAQGLAQTSQFYYWKGLYDFAEREFRGFGKVREILPDGTRQYSYFYQDIGRQGKEYRTDIYDSANRLYLRNYNIWSNTASHGYYSSRLTRQDSQLYEGTGTRQKISRITYSYDQFGNQTAEYNQGDLATTADNKYKRTSYYYNTSAYIVGLPRQTSIRALSGSPNVEQRTFYYDGSGSPTKGALTTETSWGGSSANQSITYSHDNYGNVVSETDGEGNATVISYDNATHSYPHQITNAKGHTATTVYDPRSGSLLSNTDSNGNVTSYKYDVFFRKTKEIQPYDTESSPTTQFAYSFNGIAPEVVKITRRRNHSGDGIDTYEIYDGFGNLIQTRSEGENSGNQISIDYYYDQRNRLSQISNQYQSNSASYATPNAGIPRLRYSYDILSRKTALTHQDGKVRTWQHSAFNVRETNELGHIKNYLHDAHNRLLSIKENVGGSVYTTSYVYTPNDLVATIIDPAGDATQIIYDGLGRPRSIQDPDRGTWQYNYDKANNLISQQDGRGINISLSYDALNRIKKIDYPANQDIDYFYDEGAKGVISRVIDQAGEASYEYDERLRMISSLRKLDGYEWMSQWLYDAMGNVTKTILPNGEAIDYVFNNRGLLERIPGVLSTVDYTPDGKYFRLDLENGLTTSYTYDQRLRLKTLDTSGVQSFSYNYDGNNNILTINDAMRGNSYIYNYDEIDRLKSALQNEGTFLYEYNNRNSVVSITDNAGQRSLVYGENAGPHAVTSNNATQTTLHSVVINDGAFYTPTRDVTLDIVTDRPASEMRISEDPLFANIDWQTYSNIPSFTLSSGHALKTVYVQVREDGGESEIRSDTIFYALDTNKNGTLNLFDPDDDSDGMLDDWEREHGLDPTNPSDAFDDNDNDGLINLYEFQINSDPNDGDTDDDDLGDFEEYILGTDPNNDDSDGDGIPDGEDENPQTELEAPYNRILINFAGHFSSGIGSRLNAVHAIQDEINPLTARVAEAAKGAISVVSDLSDFGSIAVSQASDLVSVTVTNTADYEVQIYSILMQGIDKYSFNVYDIPNCFQKTLQPMESCEVSVDYSPTAAEKHLANLKVLYDDDGYHIYSVPFKGTGE